MSFFKEANEIFKDNKNELHYGFLDNVDLDGTSINLSIYLHGYCDDLAMYLAEKFNYGVIVWANFHEETGKFQLIHAFNFHEANSQRQYIDVRGTTKNIDDIKVEFEDWEIEQELIFPDYKKAKSFLEKELKTTYGKNESINHDFEIINSCLLDYYKTTT